MLVTVIFAVYLLFGVVVGISLFAHVVDYFYGMMTLKPSVVAHVEQKCDKGSSDIAEEKVPVATSRIKEEDEEACRSQRSADDQQQIRVSAADVEFRSPTCSCIYADFGCSWKGMLKDLERHENMCEYDDLELKILLLQVLCGLKPSIPMQEEDEDKVEVAASFAPQEQEICCFFSMFGCSWKGIALEDIERHEESCEWNTLHAEAESEYDSESEADEDDSSDEEEVEESSADEQEDRVLYDDDDDEEEEEEVSENEHENAIVSFNENHSSASIDYDELIDSLSMSTDGEDLDSFLDDDISEDDDDDET